MKRGDENKGTTQMPYVDPRVKVTDPRALAYQQSLEARKINPPVAGGPTPPIPRLDGAFEEGKTMSEQAMQQHVQQQTGIIQPPTGPAAAGGIMPLDVLPPEAKEDPEFRQGTGSMYAAQQPMMAYKYGVIRGARRVSPQELRGTPKTRLRPETIEGLQALKEFNETQKALAEQSSPEHKAEVDAEKGSGAAAAAIGNAPGDQNIKPLSEDERKKLSNAVQNMDEFDWDSFRQMMMKDVLNNDEQRKIVEERCKPLDIGDLITQGFVLQEVPIIPGKFFPSFRSSTGEDDLAIKRLLMEEARKLQVEERYLLDKFSIMSLAVGLYAVNGKPLVDHRNEKGHFDEELFWRKFNAILRYPLHMLSSLGVHYFWFDIRVRKLFVAEKVKNG